MLEIRPNCESCDKDLAPNTPDAMICSYECTFCRNCVQNILSNVCPNCGGGFVPRPIRPSVAHRADTSLAANPASTKRINTKYAQQELVDFAAKIKNILPHER